MSLASLLHFCLAKGCWTRVSCREGERGSPSHYGVTTRGTARDTITTSRQAATGDRERTAQCEAEKVSVEKVETMNRTRVH